MRARILVRPCYGTPPSQLGHSRSGFYRWPLLIFNGCLVLHPSLRPHPKRASFSFKSSHLRSKISEICSRKREINALLIQDLRVLTECRWKCLRFVIITLVCYLVEFLLGDTDQTNCFCAVIFMICLHLVTTVCCYDSRVVHVYNPVCPSIHSSIL